MHVAIIDYGAGNVGSLSNMLTRKCQISCSIESQDSEILRSATHLILPGVGNFGFAAKKIKQRGLDELIQQFVETGGQLLGICLGAQLLLETSEEGDASGLGLIRGHVSKFLPESLNGGERIPHMGWSNVEVTDARLGKEMLADSRFYFVHSYHMEPERKEDVLMKGGFAGGFIAGVRRGNVTGVQFHPEKSHQFGIAFLKAWIKGQ